MVARVTPEREKIAAKIRGLRAKTTAAGCTEAEALSAAALLAKLLAQYNMTLDEAELRASPFDTHKATQDDWVGEKLWVVAQGIEYLTGAKYWSSAPGKPHAITFFGFAHEVEVARYLLAICSNAMTGECLRLVREQRLITEAKRRRALRPFIDGMSGRLRERLMAMRREEPHWGTGLIVVHDALVVQAMKDAGHNIETGAGKVDLDAFAGHAAGRAAANQVALNPGLAPAGRQQSLQHHPAKPGRS